jgi:hypothetical protein
MPGIPELGRIKVQDQPEQKVIEIPRQQTTIKTSWASWHALVIPATQEASRTIKIQTNPGKKIQAPT